jgi:hypothetical protein
MALLLKAETLNKCVLKSKIKNWVPQSAIRKWHISHYNAPLYRIAIEGI